MTFNPSNLTRVSNNGPVGYVFDYTTSDSIADIEANFPSPYFFDGSGNMDLQFRIFDIIRVTALDGKGIYFITNNSPPMTKLAVVSSFSSL